MSNDLFKYMYIINPNTGKEELVVENAIKALWDADTLYELPLHFQDTNGEWVDSIGLFVNCNDMFWWGCADCEPVSWDEIQSLYELCFDRQGNKKRWGSVIWACRKRQMRPQHPVEKDMRADGAWTDELEALPVRENTG